MNRRSFLIGGLAAALAALNPLTACVPRVKSKYVQRISERIYYKTEVKNKQLEISYLRRRVSQIPLEEEPNKPYVHQLFFLNYDQEEAAFFVVDGNAPAKGRAILQLARLGTERVERCYDLSKIIEVNGGLREPLFMGRDLGFDREIGYMYPYFTAKSNQEEAWENVYNVLFINGELMLNKTEDVGIESCSCYQSWLDGRKESLGEIEQSLGVL